MAKPKYSTRAMKAAMAKPNGTGPGSFWVENQGQKIGPFARQGKATKRLAYENAVAGDSGNTGKTPELIYSPTRGKKGNPAPVPRVSQNAPSGNGPKSRGYDYVTNREVRKDTTAQRKMKPRGYQGK